MPDLLPTAHPVAKQPLAGPDFLHTAINASPVVAITWARAEGCPVAFVSDNISQWGCVLESVNSRQNSADSPLKSTSDFVIKQLPYDLSQHAGLALIGKYLKRINRTALVDPAYPRVSRRPMQRNPEGPPKVNDTGAGAGKTAQPAPCIS